MITRNFETSGGHKVKVVGTLTKKTNTVEYKIDVIVEGFGSQGGTETRKKFNHNGIDYVAVIGKLPLTEDQLAIITEVRRELIIARDNHPLMADKLQYGTYEEVEINHPWMKNTY